MRVRDSMPTGRCRQTVLSFAAACGLILAVQVASGQDERHPIQTPFIQNSHKTQGGARCVQRVLAEYGQDVELAELVREMQGPIVDADVSIDKLLKPLEKRGVSAKLVDLDPAFEIEWPHPAVVEIQNGGATRLVVWMPPIKPGSTGKLWTSEMSGIRPAGFSEIRTGPVLLTSNKPIPNSTVADRRIRKPEPLSPIQMLLWGACPAAFGLGWFLHKFWRGKSQTAPGQPAVPSQS